MRYSDQRATEPTEVLAKSCCIVGYFKQRRIPGITVFIFDAAAFIDNAVGVTFEFIGILHERKNNHLPKGFLYII